MLCDIQIRNHKTHLQVWWSLLQKKPSPFWGPFELNFFFCIQICQNYDHPWLKSSKSEILPEKVNSFSWFYWVQKKGRQIYVRKTPESLSALATDVIIANSSPLIGSHSLSDDSDVSLHPGLAYYTEETPPESPSPPTSQRQDMLSVLFVTNWSGKKSHFEVGFFLNVFVMWFCWVVFRCVSPETSKVDLVALSRKIHELDGDQLCQFVHQKRFKIEWI